MTDLEKLGVRGAILTLRPMLAAMTPAQRVKVFEAIQKLYCIHCGSEQPERGSCQCWNDE